MVMSPLNGSRARLRHITLEGDKAAEREQDNARADEETAGRDDPAPDENGELGARMRNTPMQVMNHPTAVIRLRQSRVQRLCTLRI